MAKSSELALAVAAAGAAILAWKCARSRARAPLPGDVPPNTTFICWPVVGHLLTVLKLNKLKGGERGPALFIDQAAALDGLCRLSLPGLELVAVKDADLVKQLYTDLDLFGKVDLHKHPAFRLVRTAAGNGLFTADDTDEQWGMAHRILTKPFSREGMMAFVPMMNEQADKLVALIRRDVGAGGIGVINELVTKMAFETIAYCGMGTSFGSLESTDVHPFIADINEILTNVSIIARSPIKCLPKVKKAMVDYKKACQRAGDTVQEIIRKRKSKETSSPGQMPDLLDLMLNSLDTKTGKKLSDENIGYQIVTFLIAGHDTTASAMSFFLDNVVGDPRIEAKLMQEIEEVVGGGDVKFEHLNKLKYLNMCQKETLRLQPPARAVIKSALKDGRLGKFNVYQGMLFSVSFMSVHMDKALWGDEAEEFVPERWEKGLPHPFAYLPFSLGPRGCIGMEFSLVEQKIALVKLLQNFCLRRPKGENGPLELENKLFVGPTNFRMQVFERPLRTQTNSRRRGNSAVLFKTKVVWRVAEANAGHRTPLLVLYGSNGGSTQDLAQQTVLKAQEMGFQTTFAAMDDFASPQAFEARGNTSILLLCATYNGLPADQSMAFLQHVRSARELRETPLSGSSFAVFGCGNTQWAATYQAAPIAVDDCMEAIGCQRLLSRHEGDSAADMGQSYEEWLDALWPALASRHGLPLERVEATKSNLRVPSVEILPKGTAVAPLVMGYEGNVQQLRLAVNKELVKSEGDRSVRHIELDLGAGVSYKTGDHLVIYPENKAELVTQLLRRLELPDNAVVKMDLSAMTGSPEVRTVALRQWLLRAVDLSKGCAAVVIERLAERAELELEQIILNDLAKADHAQRIQMPLLELLLKFASIRITLPEVLALIPSMKPRLYSISSSPLALPGRVSITVGVVRGKTPSGREHLGVCSSFLASQEVGSKVWAAVRDTGSSFRLPATPTPMILVGPGTGLAPLRGFLHELQQVRKQGTPIGAVHLFFGCRTAADFLYEEELRAFESDGTLAKLHVAFSRAGGEKQHVQHLMRQQAPALWNVLEAGGHVFVCGDASSMAPSVREAIQHIAKTDGAMGDRGSQTFMEELRSDSAAKRYHEDVWTGNA